MHRAEVQRERVAEPLPLGGPRAASSGPRRARTCATREDQQRLAGQPEPLQRLPGAGAALEGRAEQVGAQPALYVGAGPDPQQVQRDQLRRVAQRLAPAPR